VFVREINGLNSRGEIVPSSLSKLIL
jgi:hypothetical protein